MRRLLLAGLTALIIPSLAVAQGWIIPRPCGIGILPVERGTPPIVPARPCPATIERTSSAVRAELGDRVIRYEVDERFVNRGAAVGEADYLFPLPNGAAFQDLKLSINGELVSGETMSAVDARRIYENIVRSQRDPALVEWIGHGLVRARIFPINPGEEKRVVVRFQSVASREGDALRVDYSRGSGPAGATDARGGASLFTLSYRPSPELGNPYSPTHALDIHDRDGKREVDVRGDARDLTLLVPVHQATSGAVSVLPYAPGNDDGFALITVTPPAARPDEATPRDVTLVLDVSGSMSGRKIEQARAAGRQLLGTLHPADRFRLIDFSSDVRSFRDDFVVANAANLRDATRYLDALDANGGTNIEGALREATRIPPARGRLPVVLFVTDGEPTVGERSADGLAALGADAGGQGSAQRRIFTFGLGSDVNVSLLEQLALEGRGTSQFVRPDESVERMVGVVASRLTDPVLTDVRVRVEGDVKLSRTLPAQPADIFADRDLVLLTRYTGHGAARVIVEGRRGTTFVRWETPVDFPSRERDNPFVARLWATQRVGFLSADKRRSGGNPELDGEIRTLGERYGIPTEFTSYLVVEPRFASTTTNGAAIPGTMAAPAAPAAAAQRALRFEAAKASAEQRATLNLAVADSMRASASPNTRRIDGRTFILVDGRWTDQRYKSSMETMRIKPFSNAYFQLVTELPELKPAFALGSRVIIVGKARAIELAENGASELSRSALEALLRAW